jgi:hypothetical protein
VFSMSENESTTGGPGGPGGSYYAGDSDYESEDSNSLVGDCLSEDQSRAGGGGGGGVGGGGGGGTIGSSVDGGGGGISAWQQQVIEQYNNPIYNLIRQLVAIDMSVTLRSSSSNPKRWQEIFRLSLPEFNSMQEKFLLDLVDCMKNLSHYCFDLTMTINLLKNIAAVLDQALEKIDVSLTFCVKVVQALHVLNYNCAPDVRSRIKETSLPEVRKSYVVRCLIDNAQDYYTKVAAISELSLPIQGYITSTEAKPLSDTNVAMIILGMLVEACEDLEFLLGGVDASEMLLLESAMNGGNNNNNNSSYADFRNVGSPVPMATQERLQLMLEVLEVLIECIQSCVVASAECKKVVLRIASHLQGDPLGYVVTALLNAWEAERKARLNKAGKSRPSAAQLSTQVGTGVGGNSSSSSSSSSSSGTTADGYSSSSASSSYTWWGGWGVSSAPTAAGTAAGTAGGEATAIVAPIARHAVPSQGQAGAGVVVASSSSGDGETADMIESGGVLSEQQQQRQQQPASGDKDLSSSEEGCGSSNRMTSEQQQQQNEEEDSEYVGPTNIRTFISWFCSFDQRYE